MRSAEVSVFIDSRDPAHPINTSVASPDSAIFDEVETKFRRLTSSDRVAVPSEVINRDKLRRTGGSSLGSVAAAIGGRYHHAEPMSPSLEAIMSPSEDLTRREAVQHLTVLLGYTMSSSTIAALLSGCQGAAVATGWAPKVLTPSQLELLTVVVDRILPRTDTPGASDVGVPAFIDLLLAEWAEDGQRSRVLRGLDELGPGFLTSDEAGQTALLTRLDTEAVQARQDDVNPLPFFATVKEWTLAGYYTSEIGATQELQWLAVPGRYDADVPLNEVGRTWA